ncbi:hypothetical protein ABT297_06195 [Dactylosporangium sp. NPDC000555]|uniref:hypothetical protein n=1 Tax=Dactylosporangium sp. NPDC000555 TaxID=3154260 RepID=UPI0033291CA9
MTEPEPPAEDHAPRRDPLRALRKTIAQSVVLFTAVFVFAIGQAAFGQTEIGKSLLGASLVKVHRTPAAWTVWGAGVALMVAASVLAVMTLRGREPAATGRATVWWSAGVWLAGLVLTIVYAEMVPAPSP